MVERSPRTLSYVPVHTTHAAEVVHAAITRKVNNRWRDQPFTICDRKGRRPVGQALRGGPLQLVTCKQCRTQLVEDGMLDAGD